MKPTADELEEALRKVFNFNLEIKKGLDKLKDLLIARMSYTNDEVGKHLDLAIFNAIKDIAEIAESAEYETKKTLKEADHE